MFSKNRIFALVLKFHLLSIQIFHNYTHSSYVCQEKNAYRLFILLSLFSKISYEKNEGD